MSESLGMRFKCLKNEKEKLYMKGDRMKSLNRRTKAKAPFQFRFSFKLESVSLESV